MGIPSYKIREYGERLPGYSLTEPSKGTLEVVIKREHNEARACVYNELVALALGNAIGVPLVQGVPTHTVDGVCFASLMVDGMGIDLPNIGFEQFESAVKRYPRECAGLLVFDAWIQNSDRSENLKANLQLSPAHIFAGFDHESGLLKHIDSIQERLDALRDPNQFISHPFAGIGLDNYLPPWIERIQNLSDERIVESVVLGRSVNSVHEDEQISLAEALVMRRDWLPELVSGARPVKGLE